MQSVSCDRSFLQIASRKPALLVRECPQLRFGVCLLNSKVPLIADTNIHALTPINNVSGIVLCEGALHLAKVQESAFDALDQGYLSRMVLGIYSDDEDPGRRTMLESYACTWRHELKLLYRL